MINEQRPKTVTASAARTHLANERTLLAWLRTSLKIFGLGYGILKAHSFILLESYTWYDEVLAILFEICGLCSFLIGAHRYLVTRRRLFEEEGREDQLLGRVPIGQVTGILGIIIVAATMRVAFHTPSK